MAIRLALCQRPVRVVLRLPRLEWYGDREPEAFADEHDELPCLLREGHGGHCDPGSERARMEVYRLLDDALNALRTAAERMPGGAW